VTYIASADFWPMYRAYLASSAWLHRRQLVLARDRHQCTVCGDAAGPFHIHHVSYRAVFDEPLDDLTTACSGCHSWLHMRA